MSDNKTRVMITGSRDWNYPRVINEALSGLCAMRELPEDIEIIHGDCPTGADAIADKRARALGFAVTKFPADWDTHGRAAGPIRNQQMVDTKPDMVYAFINGNSESRGTRGTVKMAKEAGLPILITTMEIYNV